MRLSVIMMMMMMNRRGLILFVLSFLPLIAWSQEKDFGIWYGVNLRYEVFRNFDLEASGVVRTFENAGKIEQKFLEGGIEYKLNNYLSAAGSYRITSNFENDLKYHLQHKLFLDLKGAVKLADVSLTGRFRFQTRFKTYIEDEEDKLPDYTARLKLKATYKTPSFPLNPYLYFESFLPLFADKGRTIGKNRFSAGIEFSIGKRHTIETEYIFQRDYLPDLLDEQIISVSYGISF